ncbi:TetR family transcriptional regulator [Vibrio maerlii]|uniref:TetR family transcriptional regulator n=1 Tax=Vibrio maerlii TaxID=2231648 RepID=UPI000E3C4416|nr:TetR family transcriptional regulator [Vibrio maerlii]
MAKITAEERARKQEALNEIVLDIFWNEGWPAVSYAEVAKRFGTTKSAIQRYYPSHEHFGLALQGKVMPIIAGHLDWSSKDKFMQSWMDALSNKEDLRFRRVLELLFHETLRETPSPQTGVGVDRFIGKIAEAFGDRSVADELFGKTFYFLIKN